MEPYREISPYTGPVLIVHGTKDDLVRPEYSRRAAAAYKNAELFMIEGGAHGFGQAHDRIAVEHLKRFAALGKDDCK